MTRLVVGVIGHVDHGKTALVRALTGQDTDRLPEEKARGISIALGFAHFAVDGITVDLIDMPGHERFVRTMIAGATGIDAVLLVVAANEGIKPQTREHIDIAWLLGLRRAVVAITKTDLVTTEAAQQVASDVMRLLHQCEIAAPAPLMTSAVGGIGIDALRQALIALAGEQRARASGLLFLPIDRAFTVVGHGSVVTGTLRGGSIAPGDTLELLPNRRTVRVRGIQVHGENVPVALPGQRVALNLRDIAVAELQRGMALATPDTLAVTRWLSVALRTVDSSPPLRNGMRLRALLGTAELNARLRLLDRDVLERGAIGLAQLHLAEAVAIPTREHVIVRLSSPSQTVAGGRILDTQSRRQRRRDPAVLARLHDLRTLAPTAVLASEVQRVGLAGTTLSQLARLVSLPTVRVAELLRSTASIGRNGTVVHEAQMNALLARIPTLLKAHPAGLPFDRLLAALPGTSAAALTEALARLHAQRIVVAHAGKVLLARPDDDRARALEEAALAAKIESQLRTAGLTPPNPGSIVVSAQTKRAVDRLLREGAIVRAVDRAKGREMLFHREAIEEARRRLAPLLHEPGLLVSEISAALGITRKYTMPLLDHLDSIGFTRRVGDRRIRATAEHASPAIDHKRIHVRR